MASSVQSSQRDGPSLVSGPQAVPPSASVLAFHRDWMPSGVRAAADDRALPRSSHARSSRHLDGTCRRDIFMVLYAVQAARVAAWQRETTTALQMRHENWFLIPHIYTKRTSRSGFISVLSNGAYLEACWRALPDHLVCRLLITLARLRGSLPGEAASGAIRGSSRSVMLRQSS